MKAKIIIIFTSLLLVVVAVVGFVLWRNEQDRRWRWAQIPMPERLARVPEEWDANTLAERLKATKKIRDPDTFREAAAQVNLQSVQPGGYLLPAEAGPAEVAKVFAGGPTHQRITFPEGFTAHQMSTRLQKNGYAAAGELRALAYPAGQPTSRWEGKWFPDTYWLALDSTAKQLSDRFHARYQEVTKKLPQPYPEGFGGKRLTLEEVTILASLVERETDVPDERPLVAGVLVKRLRDRMRLQCDASVQYAIQKEALARGDESHQIVLRSHYKFPSPYNTYLNDGLPPTAICNPGLESLRAAARPTATDYLFYVWSPKLKRHRFAKTFAEHRRNIALARQETT